MSTTATRTLQPIPYLLFNGNCEEAMRFYESTLGGELVSLMRVKDSPVASQVPPDSVNIVLNAQLKLPGGELLFGGDMPRHMPYEGIKGVNITLNFATVEEAERVYAALSDGGEIRMPFGPTFWAKASGMCVDKFGTPWIVSGEVLL